MRVPNLPIEGLDGRARSFGILSSYPPTACGLATFTAALASGLSAHDTHVGVVRVVDVGGQTAESERVIGELVNGSATSLVASSDLLNKFDVAVVHHEYGLYGGTDGDDVLEILGGLHVPSIVIAHTILTNPTPHQRSVLNDVAALADRVVVMTRGGPGATVRRLRRRPSQSEHHCPRRCHPDSTRRARAGRSAPHTDVGAHRAGQGDRTRH